MNTTSIKYSQECKDIKLKWVNPEIEEPNLLIVQPQHEGVGCAEFVRELAVAHHAKCGYRRSFHKSFLSLKFSKDISEQEVRRFFDSPRIIAELYNRFVGTFCIEVSDYLSMTDAPEFSKLIDFVSANKNDIKFIFVVSTDDQMLASIMLNILRKVVRIEQLNIGYAEVKDYADYAVELLQKRGISAAKGIEHILRNYIDDLTKKSSFAGFDTVARLVEDIVYEMRADNIYKLTKDNLVRIKELFLADDSNINTSKRVGF